nr:hypothetical protein [Caldilineaceae bacterium]
MCGPLAGLVGAGVVALFLQLGERVDLRSMFINASPELYALLSFGGLPQLFVVGAATGLVAALIGFLPDQVRRALLAGLTATVVLGTLSDQLLLILNNNRVAKSFEDWLLAPKGLTVTGAIITTVAVALFTYLSAMPSTKRSTQIVTNRPWAPFFFAVLGVALLVYLPRFLGTYHSEVLNQVGLFVLMGLGLNIVVGFTGMLDLGYVAFFALGAYTIAIFTSPEGFLHN